MTGIIDAHHHIWWQADLPWLMGPMCADRCLFGSNFPIEKLWTSYPELIAAYRKAAEKFSPEQQDAIFRNTASRVCRLGQQEQSSRMGESHAA